jgi:hypothetical protein
MPRDKDDEAARKRAMKDKKEGKAPSTQAGEFIKEEIDHIREGKHGARSPEQAIAIGLSKARRAGVDLPPPKKGKFDEEIREQAKRDLKTGDEPHHKVSRARSRASLKALKDEPTSSASKSALSRHAKEAAADRTAKERHDSAMKAVKTKGPKELSEAGKKAARTRKRNEAKKR